MKPFKPNEVVKNASKLLNSKQNSLNPVKPTISAKSLPRFSDQGRPPINIDSHKLNNMPNKKLLDKLSSIATSISNVTKLPQTELAATDKIYNAHMSRLAKNKQAQSKQDQSQQPSR